MPECQMLVENADFSAFSRQTAVAILRASSVMPFVIKVYKSLPLLAACPACRSSAAGRGICAPVASDYDEMAQRLANAVVVNMVGNV